MDNKINEEELWCEYSDLPSPKSYMECADYDSMGNHGRFPDAKERKPLKDKLKKIISKFWSNEKHKPTISK